MQIKSSIYTKKIHYKWFRLNKETLFFLNCHIVNALNNSGFPIDNIWVFPVDLYFPLPAHIFLEQEYEIRLVLGGKKYLKHWLFILSKTT